MFVEPKTYLIGYTTIDKETLLEYLKDTDQVEFNDSIVEALNNGIDAGEVLSSFYAKLCYKALTDKHNKNISKVRNISDNVLGTIKSGHGSVFEHCNLNFVTTNCSRVFTHELVRHRVGTAFSQTSGRYVRSDQIDIVFDPILNPVRDDIEALLSTIESTYKVMELKLGLNQDNSLDFTTKKKLTSALRRILPNGQANEIGWSINLRALRHLIMLRTNRGAEWEIRKVFNDVYGLVNKKFPLMFNDAIIEQVDGLFEIRGMVTQPY